MPDNNQTPRQTRYVKIASLVSWAESGSGLHLAGRSCCIGIGACCLLICTAVKATYRVELT